MGNEDQKVSITAQQVPMTQSQSITDTVKGSHQFTVKGYSLAKGMGVGKYVTSDTFHVGGYDWAMYFYPDGKNEEDNSQYVSLFIALASEGSGVRALFELMMMDQSDKGEHKVHSHFGRALESGPYTLKYRGSMWGYKRFIKRATLENSSYLKNDTLEIRCTVGVVVNSTTSQQRQTIAVPPSTLGNDLLKLFENGRNCDIAFSVDAEDFKAHKLVLCARSQVLQALLNTPMREGHEAKVMLEDIKAPVFRELLRYLYAGSIDSAVLTDTGMAQHLLAAADRFAVDDLRVRCEARLCEGIDVQTVATTLTLAEQHNATQLRRACLNFAAQNLAAVMTTDGYDFMCKSCPALQQALLEAVAKLGPAAAPGAIAAGAAGATSANAANAGAAQRIPSASMLAQAANIPNRPFNNHQGGAQAAVPRQNARHALSGAAVSGVNVGGAAPTGNASAAVRANAGAAAAAGGRADYPGADVQEFQIPGIAVAGVMRVRVANAGAAGAAGASSQHHVAQHHHHHVHHHQHQQQLAQQAAAAAQAQGSPQRSQASVSHGQAQPGPSQAAAPAEPLHAKEEHGQQQFEHGVQGGVQPPPQVVVEVDDDDEIEVKREDGTDHRGRRTRPRIEDRTG